MVATMLNPGAMVILSLHLQPKVTVYFSIDISYCELFARLFSVKLHYYSDSIFRLHSNIVKHLFRLRKEICHILW